MAPSRIVLFVSVLSVSVLAIVSLSIGLPYLMARPPAQNRVLVVLSSQDKLTLQKGVKHKTGFYLNELTIPLKQLIDSGFVPVFANPRGTPPVMDAASDKAASFGGDESRRVAMKAMLAGLEGFKSPKSLSEILGQGMDSYRGLLVPGGHAPMEDLKADANLGEILKQFHNRKKPTGLICHGPIALLSALNKPADFFEMLLEPAPAPAEGPRVAKSLIQDWPYAGYRMTVFSTAEEQVAEASQLGGKVQFYPGAALEAAGGKIETGDKFKSHVVRDRELITAQNPASDEEFGRKFVDALLEGMPGPLK